MVTILFSNELKGFKCLDYYKCFIYNFPSFLKVHHSVINFLSNQNNDIVNIEFDKFKNFSFMEILK